ncbi:sensor histidine kinase [Domibacillus enclensis]|uniref:histidine kinase n=1 Tax=Domibacillus enclensis TaxID=1017273 RepID=A0A1N6YIG4_9BACI|nr:histidine kinase [Domibacillus enclensis]OXS77637.1 two-component sensor histidine kinase [Domibacillus enclensis]SIR14291.1 Histidine kinase-, DNA gyrase B-, and HSP90-like ATPase [Domibacillus enclensis]
MNTIQKKIWGLVSVVLLIMIIIWLTLTYYNQKTQEQYNDILQRYIQMNEVTSVSDQVIMNLNNYLIEPSAAKKDQVNKSTESLRHVKKEINELRNMENTFALTNYMNLIDSLIETTERTMAFRDQEETESSASEFTEASRISKYISELTLTILDNELKTYDHFYRDIIIQSKELKKLGIWLLLLITVVLLFITYWVSLSITRPVHQLTKAANELSNGRFDQSITVESNDEIAFLAKTFNAMRININRLISEIQQKADLEHELQENKLLLKESQLRNLQSQINPHFLFNTLNILSKKAYLDGAEETSDLIVSVAELLRYNLKRLDHPVTLSEEVIVLKQYMDIQKARFTDRLRFNVEIDPTCLDVLIPGLSLQPIIENAVIHAVEPEEDGGTIWFRIHPGKDFVFIEIKDDGKGMPLEKINRLLESDRIEIEKHSSGIGFRNVVKRLQLFYGKKNLISIESEEGKGTSVHLKIPYKQEEGNHD